MRTPDRRPLPTLPMTASGQDLSRGVGVAFWTFNAMIAVPTLVTAPMLVPLVFSISAFVSMCAALVFVWPARVLARTLSEVQSIRVHAASWFCFGAAAGTLTMTAVLAIVGASNTWAPEALAWPLVIAALLTGSAVLIGWRVTARRAIQERHHTAGVPSETEQACRSAPDTRQV